MEATQATAGGDCFVVAANTLLELGADAVLVHGIPLGTGGNAEGHRYWHAWVERTETLTFPGVDYTITTTYAVDRANGNDVTLPVGAYYNLGRVEQVWRYSHAEAVDMMLKTGHYGPWVDGWEEMAA